MAKRREERYALIVSGFYLPTPNGLCGSNLAAGLKRMPGTAATGFNWNTVTRLADIANNL